MRNGVDAILFFVFFFVFFFLLMNNQWRVLSSLPYLMHVRESSMERVDGGVSELWSFGVTGYLIRSTNLYSFT